MHLWIKEERQLKNVTQNTIHTFNTGYNQQHNVFTQTYKYLLFVYLYCISLLFVKYA